eukprot:365653-Chlamydomonas_euryale.AAC.2
MVDASASEYGLFITAAKTDHGVWTACDFAYIEALWQHLLSDGRRKSAHWWHFVSQNCIGQPQAEQKANMDVNCTFILPMFMYGCKTLTWVEVQVCSLEIAHSRCLPRNVRLKLKDCRRLEVT